MKLFLLAGLLASIVADVRRAPDMATAERLVAEFGKQHGMTAEYAQAHSWLGRRALAAKDYDAAEKYAHDTYKLATAMLQRRKLDDDQMLPVALGAAIEVRAQVAAARGERDQAVLYLREELERYGKTSIAARLYKNLNLLTLEGKPAPAGLQIPRGKPALVFLWAHWCGDCKAQGPVLEKLSKDILIIGPTQTYGYVEGGKDATRAEELKYIERVRRESYPWLTRAPVSNEVFRRYGASTTPTVVLIDSRGVVRLYRPGKMTEQELRSAMAKLF